MYRSGRQCGVNYWTSVGCDKFRPIAWARLTIMVKTRTPSLGSDSSAVFRISVLYRQLLLTTFDRVDGRIYRLPEPMTEIIEAFAPVVHALGIVIEQKILNMA